MVANSIASTSSRDCGELLASQERMAVIGSLAVQTTNIIGVKGWRGKFSPFGDDENDGVVAVSEVYAEWVGEEIHVPVIHTLLPASWQVASIILERLKADA